MSRAAAAEAAAAAAAAAATAYRFEVRTSNRYSLQVLIQCALRHLALVILHVLQLVAEAGDLFKLTQAVLCIAVYFFQIRFPSRVQ